MSANPVSGATVTLKVLVYSSNALTREAIRLALGRRPALELPQIEFIEVATQPAVIKEMDAGGIDVAILDGEAAPSGGMGIARQLRDEIYKCPPLLVLIGRPQDAWLATWSRSDAVVSHPIDPLVLSEAVAALLRQRVSGSTAVRA
jgi:DNA-binding response OmpR family regulator